YAQATVNGLNPRIGKVLLNGERQTPLQRPYYEKTAELIDEEVRQLIAEIYQKTKKLLLEKREGLIALAEKLLEREILFQSDLEQILGKRPFDHRTTYDEFVNGEPDQGDQRKAAEGLVHNGVGDNSGTFENNTAEEDTRTAEK